MFNWFKPKSKVVLDYEKIVEEQEVIKDLLMRLTTQFKDTSSERDVGMIYLKEIVSHLKSNSTGGMMELYTDRFTKLLEDAQQWLQSKGKM
jgi:hypothetical protein